MTALVRSAKITRCPVSSGWGGARDGAGRPPNPWARKVVVLHIDETQGEEEAAILSLTPRERTEAILRAYRHPDAPPSDERDI